MAFLKDLPSSNPENFSLMAASSKKVSDEGRVTVAHNIAPTTNEKKIINDKRPYILQYLDQFAKLRVSQEKESPTELARAQRKRREAEGEPSTSSTKSIRLSST